MSDEGEQPPLPQPGPIGTGPQSPPAANRESAPWPAKGVLWWAGFIAFSAIGNITRFHEGGPVGDTMHLFGLLGAAASIAICLWWYDLSKRRRRRPQRSRIPGYILLGIGSSAVGTGLRSGPLLALATKKLGYSETQMMAAGVTVLYLVLAAGFLAGAYSLVFRSDEKAT